MFQMTYGSGLWATAGLFFFAWVMAASVVSQAADGSCVWYISPTKPENGDDLVKRLMTLPF